MNSTDSRATRARRYLLGQATEEERSAIEREYFADAAALDAIGAAEDDLIEDYLASRLERDERDHFEREYLATPNHRRRVETVRLLIAASSTSSPPVASQESAVAYSALAATNRRFLWPILAAASLVLAVGAIWMRAPGPDGRRVEAGNRPVAISESVPSTSTATPIVSAPAAAARVFALSISPMTVRGVDDSRAVVIPAATDVVALHLEGEADGQSPGRSRAVVRTVTGDQIWEGAVTPERDLPPGTIARIDVPSARLPADDYVIEVFGIDAAGVERERYRYFFRVRAR